MSRLKHTSLRNVPCFTDRTVVLKSHHFDSVVDVCDDPAVTLASLEVTALNRRDDNKRSFDTAGEQTLKRTAVSFVLTMQTGVGFVRSLYDNENHYRITWGFRT